MNYLKNNQTWQLEFTTRSRGDLRGLVVSEALRVKSNKLVFFLSLSLSLFCVSYLPRSLDGNNDAAMGKKTVEATPHLTSPSQKQRIYQGFPGCVTRFLASCAPTLASVRFSPSSSRRLQDVSPLIFPHRALHLRFSLLWRKRRISIAT